MSNTFVLEENILIPRKLHIGFQNRSDSLDGLLSFVSYFKKDGKIAHQTSMYGGYNGWVDKEIPVKEIDNKPRTGFVLSVGIRRQSYHGSGRSMLRIYSPDDFEFEIPVDNFSSLMQYCDMSKRYISGEAVIAFQSGKVILISTTSPEYARAVEYSDDYFGKIKKTDNRPSDELIVGKIYSPSPSGPRSLNNSRNYYSYLGERIVCDANLDNHVIDTKKKTIYSNIWDLFNNKNIKLDEFVGKKQPIYLNISDDINYIRAQGSNRIGKIIDRKLSKTKMLLHDNPIFEDAVYGYHESYDIQALERVNLFNSLEKSHGFDLDFNVKKLKFVPISEDLEQYSESMISSTYDIFLILFNSEGKFINISLNFQHKAGQITPYLHITSLKIVISSNVLSETDGIAFDLNFGQDINVDSFKKEILKILKGQVLINELIDTQNTENILLKIESDDCKISNLYNYTCGTQQKKQVEKVNILTGVNGVLNLFHPEYINRFINRKIDFGDACVVKIPEKTEGDDWKVLFHFPYR